MHRPLPVAITGIGVISPYGRGIAALLDGLAACESAIEPLSICPSPLHVVPVVGQVLDPLDVPAPPGRWLSRTDRLAVIAATEAAQALPPSPDARRDCAVVVATTVAGLSDIDSAAVLDPTTYYHIVGLGPASTYPVSRVAETVAASLALGGPTLGVSVACASGAMAIALAAGMIADGRVSMAIAGGSDALCPFTMAGFNALQALDFEPCRPFCQSRAGLNLGEAAAMVLLEGEARARARGATILARLSGWAFTNDAFHTTAPDEEGRGIAASMVQAMRAAGVDRGRIGYLNAHGTGTRLNDVAELRAYEQVFAGTGARVPVSSTKSYIGHTLGAAGAIEAVITLLSLRTGTLFPTLRLADPIDTTSVELLRGGTLRTAMDAAMSVSAGFGGSNTSLILERAGEGGRS